MKTAHDTIREGIEKRTNASPVTTTTEAPSTGVPLRNFQDKKACGSPSVPKLSSSSVNMQGCTIRGQGSDKAGVLYRMSQADKDLLDSAILGAREEAKFYIGILIRNDRGIPIDDAQILCSAQAAIARAGDLS